MRSNQLGRASLGVVVGMLIATVSSVGVAAKEGPSLKAGSVSVAPGSSVVLPISFHSATAISSLQFNFVLPEGVKDFVVKESGALKSAGKMATPHRKDKTVTCIVYGAMNQTSIPNGELVTVELRIPAKAAVGTLKLPLSKAVFADPAGTSIPPGTLTAGSINVIAPTK